MDGRICAIRTSLKSWDSHLLNGVGLDPGDDFLKILCADSNDDPPRLFMMSI